MQQSCLQVFDKFIQGLSAVDWVKSLLLCEHVMPPCNGLGICQLSLLTLPLFMKSLCIGLATSEFLLSAPLPVHEFAASSAT